METSLDSPHELQPVILPSQGLYYGDKLMDGQVWITPWTTVQEEAINKAQGNNKQDLFDIMVRNNVKLPQGLTFDELLVTDAFFLLIQLRILSLCTSYSFVGNCVACKTNYDDAWRLDRLDQQVPDDTFPDEPIEVKLPKSKTTVGLRFLRIADQVKLREWANKSRTSTLNSSTLIHTKARQIMSIEGRHVAMDEKLSFVRGLTMLDSKVMEIELDKWETGYVVTGETTCTHCGCVSDIVLPLDPSFFRPSASDIEFEASILSGD